MNPKEIRYKLMGAGYIHDISRSHIDYYHTEGVDYWVDCVRGGRDIRFVWVYRYEYMNEAFEVLNREGTRPMLSDQRELFELNRAQDYESLDMFGTQTPRLEMAIRISRLERSHE